MKTIGIVLPYYGKFHNYFQLVLNSMTNNPTIDFYIITDIENHFVHGENVRFIDMSIDEIRKRASKECGFKCSLSKPYKLCDYKPAYGLIFKDILAPYDFWGYCDPDAIYGNIRKFVTEDILNKYERILNLGHFTLYKNIPKVNMAFMNEEMPAYSYKEAFKAIGTVGFDERGAICCVFDKNNPRQYTNYKIIYDIFPVNARFSCHNIGVDTPFVFSYENGSLSVGIKLNGGVPFRRGYVCSSSKAPNGNRNG